MERDLARFSSPEREAVHNMGFKIEVTPLVNRILASEKPEVELIAPSFLGDVLLG